MAMGLRRFKRRMNVSLSRLIGLGFGAFVALALALVLGLSVMANFKNTFSLLNDKAILITRSMEGQLRSYFDALSLSVVNLKPYFDRGDLGFDNIEETSRTLEHIVAANPVLNVLVVSRQGEREFGAYRAADGTIGMFNGEMPEQSKDVVQLPRLTPESGPTWGDLIRNEYGTFANVSVPLVRHGEVYGTLTAAAALESVERAVANLDEGVDMTTFIIADGDRVVMHSDTNLLQTGGKPNGAMPMPRDEFGDPVLAALGKNEDVTLSEFREAARQGIKVSMIDVLDKEFIMIRAVIPGYSTQPWTIGQYIRGTSISREVERLSGSAFVGFFALVIAVLVAVWIGRRVARPLRDLARQSARVGSLALDEVEPLPRSRVAELDQVALAFNAMVEGLKAMNTYVPRSLFTKLMRLGGQGAAEAREAELTILFSDIVGFTALSENMSASETARHLNDHFAILVRAVEEEGGTVDKFIGDGMLAFWGAPDTRADHAAAAIRAARKIACELKIKNDGARATGEPELHVRIGIHTGTAVVGNVGALDRWNYTVVGDTVNTADRLQALGKEFGAGAEAVILVSASTAEQLPDHIAKTPVGAVHLRGKSGSLDVWSIDPEPGIGELEAPVESGSNMRVPAA